MGCTQCRGSGTIVAQHIATGCLYSFRCGYCKTAIEKKISTAFPEWHNKFAAAYRRDAAIEPDATAPQQPKKFDAGMAAANDDTYDEEDAPF